MKVFEDNQETFAPIALVNTSVEIGSVKVGSLLIHLFKQTLELDFCLDAVVQCINIF